MWYGPIPMTTNSMHTAWKYFQEKPLAATLIAFLFGTVCVGSLSNVYPLYFATFALTVMGPLAIWAYVPLSSCWRALLSVIWLIIPVLVWECFFQPTITTAGIEKAHSTISSNNTQCADIGRREALLFLAEKKQDLSHIDIDCAEIAGINFPPGTRLVGLGLSHGDAAHSVFSGTVMTGAFLTGTNFTDANFENADLRGAIFGHHFLFNRETEQPLGCFPGANLTGAKLKNADLNIAYLVGVKGLTCERLMEAKNWSNTLRDPELTCGAEIPDLSQAYSYMKNQKCER